MRPQTIEHPVAPAVQYLRMLWAARWLYLSVVAAFVAGAVLLAALLPKSYQSDSVISIQPTPSLQASAMFYTGVLSAGQSTPTTTITPQSLVRRFQANRTVTLAARDAGIIGPDVVIDERQISKWVAIDDVGQTDLVVLGVRQPTPAGARRFAERILVRASETARDESEVALKPIRDVLTRELQKAETAVRAKEQAQLQASRDAVTGPERDLRIDRAKTELRLARDTYEGIHKRLSALELVWTEQIPAVRVVDPPTTPLRPAFPRPVLFISIGVILGVLIATLVVVLRSMLAVPHPMHTTGHDEVATLAAGTSLPR